MTYEMSEWAASIRACARSTSYEEYLELLAVEAERMEAADED